MWSQRTRPKNGTGTVELYPYRVLDQEPVEEMVRSKRVTGVGLSVRSQKRKAYVDGMTEKRRPST